LSPLNKKNWKEDIDDDEIENSKLLINEKKPPAK
jgi:hypothetical protein